MILSLFSPLFLHFPLTFPLLGGPHSASTIEYHPAILAFTCLGFAVLQVNYLGSLGATHTSALSLRGQIGTADVSDVLLATQKARLSLPTHLHSAPAILNGGSHGGFISLHLISRHSDIYSGAALRNPVVDISSMATMSDIPDWCFEESSLLDIHTHMWQKEAMEKMFEVSPARYAHDIKRPLLLLIGMMDRRVPPAQGGALAKYVRARGGEVEVRRYPKGGHALEGVEEEADSFEATLLFVKRLVEKDA